MPKAKTSSKRKNAPINNNSSRNGFLPVRLFLLVALGISGFLAWRSFSGGSVPGCGPESDCDKVLGSRWAYLFGMPVSLFAVPVYLTALGLSFRKPIPWKALLAMAVLIVVAAAWFVGLQVFAIGAFCKFCMVAHASGSIAAIILVWRNPLALPSWATPAAVGTALAALLAVAQIVSPAPSPKRVITQADEKTAGAIRGDEASASNQSITALAPRNAGATTLSIIRGQFTLDLTQLPVSGSPRAPKKMVKLFDYTCHHCRDLHHLLDVVKAKYPTELAVVSLPMPLDAKCNPVMRSTPSAHVNACEYARLGLAVFFAKPAKFEEFSNWLFAPQRPPELDQAREYAAGILGRERLIASLADPRIDAQIRTDVEIYAASSRLGKSTAMPQMIFPAGASIGSVNDLQQLEGILSDALGLGASR